MIRAVKSLPSLRLLYQQEANVLKTQTQTSAKHIDLITPSQIRNVHQTTKKETILLDQSANKSKYTTMNLQGLKMECRKRGLKVSGRKLDLVQRLVSQDESAIENARFYTNTTVNRLDLSQHVPQNLKDFKLDHSKNIDSHKMKIKNDTETLAKKSFRKERKLAKGRIEVEGNTLQFVKTREQREQQIDELKKQIKMQKQLDLKKQAQLEKQAEREKKVELMRQNELRRQIQLKKDQEQKKQMELKKQIELQKQVEVQKQNDARAKAAKKNETRLKSAIKDAASATLKQKTISNVLNKAHQESKSNIINEAREKIQSRAKEEQKKRHQSKQDDKLTSRDVRFLTIFSASTIGWWSLKE